MSTLPHGSLATVSDYLDLAPGGPRYELIQGELRMAPAPNLKHQRVSRNLEFILFDYLKRNPIGEIFHAPCDVFLSEINVFQPDILFVSEQRKQLLSERGVEGAPDVVIEILSPSTARQDLGPKKRVYTVTGVREYWVIDPELEQLSLFRLPEDPAAPFQTLRKSDCLISPHFPDLTISLSEVFP